MHINSVIRQLVSDDAPPYALYRHELLIRLSMWMRFPSIEEEQHRVSAISAATLRYCDKRGATTLGSLKPAFRRLLDETISLGWLAKAAGGEAWSIPDLQGPYSEVRIEASANDPIDITFQKYAFCAEIVEYLLWVDEEHASISKAMYIARHPSDGEYWNIAKSTAWSWLNSIKPSIPFFYFKSMPRFRRVFINPFERDFARKLDELAQDRDLILEFLTTAKLVAERLGVRMQRHMPRATRSSGKPRAVRQAVGKHFGFPIFPDHLAAPIELVTLKAQPWVYEALKGYRSGDQETDRDRV